MPTQPLWNLGPVPIELDSVSRTISGALDRAQRQQQLDLHEARLRREEEQEKSAGEILGRQAALYAQQGQAPQTQADQLMAAGPSRSLPSFARTEGGQPSQTIRGVIERAAAANEVSPDYLTRMVGVESGFDPNARNPSGAAGLAQFVPGTWKQYGGNASPLNPEANAMAAGAFTKDNQAVLRQQLGRDPTYGELYLAHQQGAGGAAGLLANPDRPAAEVVGLRAVASNLPRGAGDPRTVTAGQFASLWTQRFADLDAGRSSTPSQPAPGVPAPQRPAPVVVAEGETPDEIERNVRIAEGSAPRPPQLPPMAAGRAGLPPAADLAAPGAVPAGYTVPPAPGVARVAPGAPAGVPAVAASAPAAPAPAAQIAPAAPAAVLSQGLRAAAQAGMPPQQLAIVQAMAMNPKLQSFAAQIIGKYAAPERQALQRFTGPNGDEYAFDPASGRTAPVAQFGGKQDIREVGGHLLSIRGEDVRDITPAGVAKAGDFQILHNERDGTIARVDKNDPNPDTAVTILRPPRALPASVKDVGDLRQEVNKLDSVKRYQAAVPSLGSMAKNLTVNTKQADMDFFYGVAKVMDPESVVRDSETGMVRATGNLDDRIRGAFAKVTSGGTLGEDTKRGLFNLARGRIAEYRGQLDNDLERYRSIAGRLGMRVEDVLPNINPMPDIAPKAAKGAGKPDAEGWQNVGGVRVRIKPGS